MISKYSKAFSFCAATLLLGCATAADEDATTSTAGVSWEEFRDTTYRENFEGGHFIVNGDTPIVDEKSLREF